MSANHGSTPAAWTAVGVAMVGAIIASIASLRVQINVPLMIIGLVIAVLALPVFWIMARMGLND